MSLHTFGDPHNAEWQQSSLSDVSCELETLVARESEYMEQRDAKFYGNGPLAVRLDLVEMANELVCLAESGNLKRMRKARFLLRKGLAEV